jgi:OmpA-OmpF porin, OOP family
MLKLSMETWDANTASRQQPKSPLQQIDDHRMKGTPMNYRLGTLGLIAAMVLATPALAQDETTTDAGGGDKPGVKASLGKNFYFSPSFNYLRAANSRGTQDGYGGQVALGKSVTSGLNLEITAQYLSADAKSGTGYTGTATLNGVGLGAMVFPSNYLPDLYVPLSLMRGQVKDNPGPIPDYSTTVFDVGLGYLLSLGKISDYLHGASLRTEVRYRTDAHGRELAGVHTGERKAFYEGVASVGLLIPLGNAPVAAPPAAEPAATEVVPVAPTDSDGDGVTDDLDQCPDTPAGTPVDEKGCPIQAAPTPVEAPACKQPDAGEPIDLNGCKIGDSLVLKGVNFELDSAHLTPNAKTILDGVADALLAQQNIKAEIGGYTSSEGSDRHNQKLSERRAESVKQYLTSRGIDAGRLTTHGYGKSSPVADNATNEGRELNRRVELKVMDDGSAAAPAAATPAAEVAPAADAAAPAETPAAPADASTTPATDGSAQPADTSAAPADSTAAPADASAVPAPEVQSAQPAQ